jgi:hypothetical protein
MRVNSCQLVEVATKKQIKEFLDVLAFLYKNN